MAKITLDTDVCGGAYCLIVNDDGQDILVQTDWELPGVASTFGWNIREVKTPGRDCDHQGTDGTIDCPDCGLKAIAFIEEAGEWINSNDGATAEDPGYFEGE
jgi:hypothetical protein